jgi:hypothetical protein
MRGSNTLVSRHTRSARYSCVREGLWSAARRTEASAELTAATAEAASAAEAAPATKAAPAAKATAATTPAAASTAAATEATARRQLLERGRDDLVGLAHDLAV